MQRPSDASYIPTLDGWRAVAITGVFLCHIFSRDSIFNIGELGVMLFFGISGFLITNRMLREWDKTGSLSLKNFYIRRVFRILPPAFLYLAVVFVLGMLSVIPVNAKEVLASVFFFRNYVNSGVGWYTAHFWSLSVEEHFYLLWPGILVLSGRKRALWVAPILAVVSILWRVVDGHFNFVARLAHDPSLIADPFRSDYCMDGLFWGCTLALWFPMIVKVPRFIGTALGLGIAAVVVGFRYFVVPHHAAVAGIGMAALIGCTVLKPQSWMGQVLEWPALRFIGRISYSLYLWQMLFLTWFEKQAWQRLPWNVVLVFPCALFSYYVIEKPLIRLGQKIVRSNSRRVPVAV